MTTTQSFGEHAFDIVARGTIVLHRLIADGKGDEPQADAVRDSLDAPLSGMSQSERERARLLSEDLYSLSELAPDRGLKPLTPSAQIAFQEIYDAKQQRRWDVVLDIIRKWQDYLPLVVLSYLRGSTWADAGKYEIAAAFYAKAAEIDPKGNYPALYLYALNKSNPAKAKDEADRVVHSPGKYSAPTVIQAAHVIAASARPLPANEARTIESSLIPVVEEAMKALERDKKQESESYLMAALLLGSAHEHKGDTQSAYEYYSRGLSADPKNDALLILRGMLMYGVNTEAIADLELAVKLGSQTVWPYFFLAHHYLSRDRFDDCRKLCEHALDLPASNAMHSELLDWLAIAEAQLNFPVERVRRLFEDAIRLDPQNERAKKNLATFNGLSGRPQSKKPILDRRTESSLRSFGMAEYDLEKMRLPQMSVSA
jgi:tetratricopeptide (TPR) repeat protein